MPNAGDRVALGDLVDQQGQAFGERVGTFARAGLGGVFSDSVISLIGPQPFDNQIDQVLAGCWVDHGCFDRSAATIDDQYGHFDPTSLR